MFYYIVVEGFVFICSNRSDGLIGTKIDYQFLGKSRMRNQNISTEILGDLNTGDDDSLQSASESDGADRISMCSSLNTTNSDQSKESKNPLNNRGKGRPYVVATLDGSIILVQDEVILW